MNDFDAPFFGLTRRQYLAMPPMPLDQRKIETVEFLMSCSANMYRTFRDYDFPRIFKQSRLDEVLELLRLLDQVDDTHKFVMTEMRVTDYLSSWQSYFNRPFPIYFPENSPSRLRG